MTAPRYADYPTVAASLRYIADRLDTLADAGLPKPYIHLAIQPLTGTAQHDDATAIQAVDTVAQAIFGYDGTTEAGDSSYYHVARGHYAGIRVHISATVSPPEVRRLQAEIDKLRRERDRLAGGADDDNAGGEVS